MGAFAAQAARKSVGPVAQLPGGFGNLFPGVFVDGRVIFQAPAHRRGRNIKVPGNIINGYFLFSRHGKQLAGTNKRSII